APPRPADGRGTHVFPPASATSGPTFSARSAPTAPAPAGDRPDRAGETCAPPGHEPARPHWPVPAAQPDRWPGVFEPPRPRLPGAHLPSKGVLLESNLRVRASRRVATQP